MKDTHRSCVWGACNNSHRKVVEWSFIIIGLCIRVEGGHVQSMKVPKKK